ncbi:MAG: alkene reductase [Flammeovirgaceae bacterium]
MSTSKLFSSFQLGSIELKNRIVMAPMTRSRAIDNIPNTLMAEYYAQRAEAGLIITEGTAPSANGVGYPRIPGVFSEAQVAGWKLVTDAVHAKGGRIFIQLMHTGRTSHPLNMAEGTEVLAPSAIQLSGEMYTDQEGMKAYPVPKEMTKEDILAAQEEYVQAAKNAIAAGFDGIELHGANGYLIEQFINPASNQRTDEYGGSAENRNRFVVELAEKVVAAIGGDKVGIRLSPYGVFNDMNPDYPELVPAYTALAKKFSELGLVYIHLVDHTAMGAPAVPDQIKETIRTAFGGTIIGSGGFTKETAEHYLQEQKSELVAFGRPFIANPDLVNRFKHDYPLADPDFDTFYTPGEKGYTDYALAEVAV